MSEYGDDEDEWFEDQWYVEDVENLSDTLVSSAYGHEPPFAPEGYDAYDSDMDEYYTDGDDDYFDGPPGSPSPPPTPLPKDFPGLPRISSNLVLLTPPTPNIPTPPTPQPAEVAECLSKIEIKFREAMAGKKFYGEAEEGDEKILKIGVRRRRRRDLAGAGGSKGEEGMRKRRKVERPSEMAKATPPVDGGKSNAGDSIGIVEIGGRGDAGSEEDEEDNDDGSAEGYDSDGLDGEEEKSERRRSLREEVEIRPPGKPDGGKSVGGAGRKREKAMVESGLGAGGKRNSEKRRTSLR